jgi:hypothetical protein
VLQSDRNAVRGDRVDHNAGGVVEDSGNDNTIDNVLATDNTLNGIALQANSSLTNGGNSVTHSVVSARGPAVDPAHPRDGRPPTVPLGMDTAPALGGASLVFRGARD